MNLWQRRYPEIQFFLSFFPYNRKKLPKDSKPFLQWIQKQSLHEIEVIYIIGLLGFSLPKRLYDWLNEKKQRALVFVEEALGAFASFTEESLLEHPQIHFFYSQEDPISTLAELFPTDRLLVYETKPFDTLQLIRKSVSLSALYSDVLYSHKIVENVLANFHRLEGCFHALGQFEEIPAIICGAGPSLVKTIPILKSLEERALIFAGGSAITALTLHGVQPHIAIALDPNDEEFRRLKQAEYFEGPFLFAPRLHQDVFHTTNGPFGYLKSDTGGLIEQILEKKLEIQGSSIGPDLGPEAFSVTTMAVASACAFKCNPIIFVGVDLAFTEGKHYATGIHHEMHIQEDPRALEKKRIGKDIYGKQVETLLKWEMESDCIAAFSKKHPEVKFFNATEGGIGFANIPNLSLEKILLKARQRDLRGEIHRWIQASPLQYKKEKFSDFLIQLETSLQKCSELCTNIFQLLEEEKDKGQGALYQIELREEIAYIALLEGIDVALTRLLFRYYPHLDQEIGKKQREIVKYREMQRQIDKFLSIVKKYFAKSFFIFFITVFLANCSGLIDSEKKKIRKMNAVGEHIYRSHEEYLFPLQKPLHHQRENYPWEGVAIGKYPKITQEFFRCKGNLSHPQIVQYINGEEMHLSDCGGTEQHSLPFKEGREFIYPALIDLLNYVQQETQKKVVITCGHRCPSHNAYADSSVFNATSKHMMGAEVDFYVKGMEWTPEDVIKILKRYYKKHPRFSQDERFTSFQRYENTTNVSTLPWYNKEIFIKLFKKDEGRDFDNDHYFPFISIQIHWDRDLDIPVLYSWDKAFNGYLRY